MCWTGSTALKDVCSVKERKLCHREDSEDKEEAEGTCLYHLEGRLEIVGDTQPPKQCLWMHVSFFSFSFLIKTPEASAEMVLWHFVSHILLGHNHCYTLKNTIHKPFLCPLFSLSLICFPLSPTEGDSSTLEGTEVPPEWQGVMSSFSASSPLMRACKNDLRPCWGKSPVTKIGKTTNNLITHTN